MEFNKLTPQEEHVIVHKGTEPPGTGKFNMFFKKGAYRCRRCNALLFKSDAKFDSGSGWPSFDEAIPGAVKETVDSDGIRTEITCAKCGAHLGHVFRGERKTPKNTRHCVNSLSLDFMPSVEEGQR
ncbi:methionine-R-sulfoxide reductase [Dehalogenimonas sp. 4OHTPN]|uniref:peptide-methionine (R)-S-oxide reductase n=1 Tax=Dehalogenimonas sp. 4OHTPN TaxID=3166643 RepID=A0AAU8G8T6_9CHLR